MAKTDGFQGVTGVFSFNEFGDPIKSVARIQVKDGKWVKVDR